MIKPKLIVGIALIVLSVILLGLILISVGGNMAHSGPISGKITSYQPPFYGHGLWMVVSIILGAASFLGGILLVSVSRKS